MSLSSYARATFAIGYELRELLQQDAFAPMRAALSPLSAQKLAELRLDNEALVAKIATAQPKPRAKLLAGIPNEQQFWLIAAAAQMAFEASSVLDEADILLRPGGSYRDMIGEVQRVLTAQYSSREARWPFPTPSPFDDLEEQD